MRKSRKDEAIDSLIGADAYFVVACRDQGFDQIGVDIYAGGANDYGPAMAEEMWRAMGQILFGEECPGEDQGSDGDPA